MDRSDKFQFTTNSEISTWEPNDKMGYFVGYVCGFKGSQKASNGGLVGKTVFGNLENTKVQVVAWSDKFIRKLKEFSTLNTVVEIDGALIRDLNNLWKFNDGNVAFELRIGDQTKMKKLGVYVPAKEVFDPSLMPLENLIIFGGIVKIQGFILNPIRLLNAKERHYGLGSIAIDGRKLEIKVNSFTEKKDQENPFDLGIKVEIIGSLKRRNIPRSTTSCPAYFEVEDESYVKILKDKSITDIKFFLSVYRYIK